MDSELQRYAQLANPVSQKAIKSKAPSISNTLSDLTLKLQQARESLLNQPDATPQAIQQIFQDILANVETSKGQIDERLKETHASGMKIAKLVDKKNATALPDYPPIFQGPMAQAALRRTIAQHLVRTGSLKAAHVFAEEAGIDIPDAEFSRFGELQTVINALRKEDLKPALTWVEANREFLEARDSPLEFLLHRSQYLRALSNSPAVSPSSEPSPALTYASTHLLPLQHKYPHDIPRLINCMLYGGSPDSLASSYPEFASPAIHTCLEGAFTREYCAQRQVSKQAPLKVVSNIGGGTALPRIEKGKKIMKERKGDWSHTEEIPVEIPLPPENYYHSIFICPVSREQATETNPPMMLQCGHAIVRDSLNKLTKAHTRIKCPYCPKESNPREAIQLYF